MVLGDERELKARALSILGGNVAAARRAAGLTVRELADAAEVSVSSLMRIERGKVNFSFIMFLRLAAALGVDASVLFDLREPPHADPAGSRRGVEGRDR